MVHRRLVHIYLLNVPSFSSRYFTKIKRTSRLGRSLALSLEILYYRRDEIVNFPFLDGDVPRSPSYGVYISQFIRFARVCSNVDEFNNRNLYLTVKLLNKVIDIIKFEKHFS